MMLQHKPVITVMLMAISILIAIFSQLGKQLEPLQYLLYSYYLQPQFLEIKQGQLWRLVTPIFIHFGVLHLLMNALVLWMFGRLMERVHGSFFYLCIITVIAIISNTAQYMVSGPLFGGLSGVLYGLLGLIWTLGRFTPDYPLHLNTRFTYIIIGWLILCWSGLLLKVGIHIANTAHTAGLVSGIAIALILTKWGNIRLKQ